jgi:hypothetical protein
VFFGLIKSAGLGIMWLEKRETVTVFFLIFIGGCDISQ